MTDIIPVLSSSSVWGVLARFGFNLIWLFVLIGVIYFRYSKKERFLFTFFITGTTVFFVCSIMNKLTISLGAGFGLFAIFQVLRFRTRNFGVKDMAYIFSVIGISVINAVVLQVFNILGVVIMNLIVILTAFVLEQYLQSNNFAKYKVAYDNLDMLRPENQQKLLQEMSQKTGRNIFKVKIIEMDFKKDIAHLEIYYKEQ
jgi:hypothetical protein